MGGHIYNLLLLLKVYRQNILTACIWSNFYFIKMYMSFPDSKSLQTFGPE